MGEHLIPLSFLFGCASADCSTQILDLPFVVSESRARIAGRLIEAQALSNISSLCDQYLRRVLQWDSADQLDMRSQKTHGRQARRNARQQRDPTLRAQCLRGP